MNKNSTRSAVAIFAAVLNACGPADLAGEPVGEEELRAGVLALDGHCRRIGTSWLSNVPQRHLDAYTNGDGEVVTRELQQNDTQLWCFTETADGRYLIQHRNFEGQYLDAYTSSSDYKAVLRDYQGDNTQLWRALSTGEDNWYQFQQGGSGRALEAKMSINGDYRVVTRPVAPAVWQEWQVF